MVSEKQLAMWWACHRSTVARLLREAGIHPVYLGQNAKGLKRYLLSDIEKFVEESKGLSIIKIQI